jgi:transcriptional antiterminator
MAKKKEKAEKTKVEKKIVNKQEDKEPQLFSIKELADRFGVSVYQMDSMFSIRGIDRKTKLSLEEARKLF